MESGEKRDLIIGICVVIGAIAFVIFFAYLSNLNIQVDQLFDFSGQYHKRIRTIENIILIERCNNGNIIWEWSSRESRYDGKIKECVVGSKIFGVDYIDLEFYPEN